MTGAGHELVIERVFDAPRDVVWRAATEHFAEWWCPKPWRAEPLALEWRTGGRFSIAMHGPDGERHGGDGMLREVTPGKRFVFTNMLGEDWTPQSPQPVGIVGEMSFADAGDGRTLYRARALHSSSADRDAHAEMGFTEGWGMCADQLGDVAKRLTEKADA
ncbi:SRPBCC domain-containing protein [Sphingomonas sp. SUN019]|uniref:SRPBCC domain-containing protein n=1 Tax=Sphingomonas sp. SUN019 TaxID=2937788 RepID=UPI00216489B9|nr:SRPBCC domain-containing protein [Sphingomonas sp. SUN019]UVO49633.1 SRPBCC domain-containing protein [Sphingomonas sp. SUN019]